MNCRGMLQKSMPGKTVEERTRKFVVILERLRAIEKNKVPTKVSFLIHKAPNKNQRKFFVLVGVEDGTILEIQDANKETGKNRRLLQLDPIPRTFELGCPTHCARRTIGTSDKCQ